MARPTGLGKGLNSLFVENTVEQSDGPISMKLMDIVPNKDQPRKTFDEGALAELSESIAKHGVLQPLLVRPMPNGTYQLVAGERRWRASRMAGLSEVPVVIKELTDVQTMEIALIENLQREDLNPIEEAEGLQALIDTCGMTQDEIAVSVGRSRPAVTNALRLLRLPEEVRDLTREGKLSAGHARALLAFDDPKKMMDLARQITQDDSITVRQVERLAKQQEKSAFATGKRTKRRDSYYDEVELALSEALGRKVKVYNGRAKGTLEIEFYSLEDLKNLANQFREQ